jgi:uncharacterized membrane protein YeiB
VVAAITARALVIGAIGVVLASFATVDVILPFYALFFLLAIPLLRLRRSVLLAVAGVLVVVAPLVVLASFAADLPDDPQPTLGALLDPAQFLATLTVIGEYPAVEYMAYICIGLAIGRSDLGSARLARWLFAGGVVVAVAARAASAVLMYRFGGLEHLAAAAPGHVGREARDMILWEPEPVQSWWWLAGQAPYTATPLGMLGGIATAVGVVGAALLLCRTNVGARLTWPLAAAGSMTLTLYSAHVVLLATELLSDRPLALFALMVAAALAFASWWRLTGRGQGPLERLVAAAARRASRWAAERAILRR